MSTEPSMDLRLYGTEERVNAPRVLSAGSLTAEFEAGNLRYIRHDGVELLRAVSFIVRDRNWGTYNPDIDNVVIEEDGDSFRVRYDATTRDGAQEFVYSADITAHADGRLDFRATGHAVDDFVTNRTGFVVLHPGEIVAGQPVEVEHVDGSREHVEFPIVIDPLQPMMDLRALTHEAAPGLKVTCRMEGDTYEMEDQRNWTDASFKTYVRPLALPWPYTLEKGVTLEQSVTLRVDGSPDATATSGQVAEILIDGDTDGTIPPLGVGLDPDDARAALEHADDLCQLGIDHVVCRFDSRRGHDRRALEDSVAVATALDAAAWLEFVVASLEEFEAEIESLGAVVRDMGSPFETLLVSPCPDLKCTLPGSPWPPCPPLADIYTAVRKAFPGVRLGGGMFSYFTELNRKRPPLEPIDIVTFTTSAMVHAGDDRSVMEGLGSLPFIARSAREIARDKPYAVGPSAIGMRDNPYGEKPMENPDNIRQAMNRNDPRQRGMLGAAWNLCYVSNFVEGGAAAVTLGGTVGPFGLVHAPMPWPQPWYDDAGGLYPVFHVVRGLSRLTGRKRRRVTSDLSSHVQGIAADTESGTEIWLANRSGTPSELTLPGIEISGMATLDADSFVEASRSAAFMDRLEQKDVGSHLTLAPFAVVRLVTSDISLETP